MCVWTIWTNKSELTVIVYNYDLKCNFEVYFVNFYIFRLSKMI